MADRVVAIEVSIITHVARALLGACIPGVRVRIRVAVRTFLASYAFSRVTGVSHITSAMCDVEWSALRRIRPREVRTRRARTVSPRRGIVFGPTVVSTIAAAAGNSDRRKRRG